MDPNPDPRAFLPPDIMANQGPDRLSRTLEVCREFGKFRATTTLLSVDFGAEDQELYTFIIYPDEETSAAWLHDPAQDRMAPCTEDQHWFATANIMSRLHAYPFT